MKVVVRVSPLVRQSAASEALGKTLQTQSAALRIYVKETMASFEGVTLFLLWQEYKAATPNGLQYSWFCHTYRAWAQKLDLVMRQPHRAGEKLFVDDAGQGIPVGNGPSGEVHEVAIFVAVLGASNYTYAEATWTQSLPDWIGSHVRTFAALGGVPEIIVPDNLQAAVTRAHRYEPEINRTYATLARH